MQTVGGRIKDDYRYSVNLAHNIFPWSDSILKQQAKIVQTAQTILDARAMRPTNCLADLRDDDVMPPELPTAYQKNNRAVWEAYGKACPFVSSPFSFPYFFPDILV